MESISKKIVDLEKKNIILKTDGKKLLHIQKNMELHQQ